MQPFAIDRKTTSAGGGHQASSLIGRAGAGTPKPCCSVPAFVGPERGGIRAWRRPDEARHGGAIRQSVVADLGLAALGAAFGPAFDQPAFGQPVQRPDAMLVRLRRALRRERLLGRSGASGYSVDRHDALRRALDEATSRSAGPRPGDRVVH